MKQYTNEIQTDKLIELGFEKPKSCSGFSIDETKDAVFYYDYSIGELIEMLPMTITHEIWFGEDKGKEGVWGLRIDTNGTEYSWEVSYIREHSAHLYLEGRSELIDALYDMILKLKEEEII